MRRGAACFLAVFLLLLSGCAKISVNFKAGQKIAITCGNADMNEHEVRLVALYYKTKFESCYGELLGSDFWSMDAGDGMTYEQFVKENHVWKECRAILCMSDLASESGIRLTDDEKEEIADFAEEFHGSLTEDELDYCQASVSDVRTLLEDCLLAEKEAETLLADKDVEISEEESRVADLEVIATDTEEKAEEILSRIEGGENFDAIAESESLSARSAYSVAKGELVPAADEAVFQLKNGEVSSIIQIGDLYYIFKVTNAENALLSSSNRENMLADLAHENWSATCEAHAASAGIRRNAHIWNEISLQGEGNFPYVDLFAAFPM